MSSKHLHGGDGGPWDSHSPSPKSAQKRKEKKNSITMKKADLKVVLLGDQDVGKTSLLLRYMERRFQETVATIGASFLMKQWGNFNIALWDTAGEEKYQGLNLFYIRNSSGAILMFDLTQHETFETLKTRYLPLLSSLEGFVLKVVVGSKFDLLSTKDREVNPDEAKEFARSINETYCETNEVPYFETSSRTGYNVDQVFELIFEHFYPNRGNKPRSDSTNTIQGFQNVGHGGITLSRSLNDLPSQKHAESWKCCST